MHIDVIGISQMSSCYQVTFRTLRFYEDRGLLRPIRRGTARLYTVHDRVRLELILKGKKLGFTLAEIESLVAASPAEDASSEVDVVRRLDRSQVERQLAHLERQRATVEAGLAELRKALGAGGEAVVDEPQLRTA